MTFVVSLSDFLRRENQQSHHAGRLAHGSPSFVEKFGFVTQALGVAVHERGPQLLADVLPPRNSVGVLEWGPSIAIPPRYRHATASAFVPNLSF